MLRSEQHTSANRGKTGTNKQVSMEKTVMSPIQAFSTMQRILVPVRGIRTPSERSIYYCNILVSLSELACRGKRGKTTGTNTGEVRRDQSAAK